MIFVTLNFGFSQNEKSFSEKLEGIQTSSKELTKSASTDESSIGQSGEMTTTIPLLTITSRTLSFPIQLNYRSGITTDQKSGPVGLGWQMPIGSITRDYGAYEPDYSSGLHEAEMRNFHSPTNTQLKGKFVSTGGAIVDPNCHTKVLAFDAIERVEGRVMPLSDKYHVEVPGMLSNTFFNGASMNNSNNYGWVLEEQENWRINESYKTFEISQEFSRINEINLVHNATTNRPLLNSSYAAAIVVPPYVKNAYFWHPTPNGDYFSPQDSQRVVRYEDFDSFTITDDNGIRYVFGRPLRGQKFIFSNDPYWSNHEGSCSNSANGSFWKIDFIAEWLLTAILSPDYIDLNENGIPDKNDEGDWIRFEYTSPTKVEDGFLSGSGVPSSQTVPRHREWSSFSQTDKASSLMRERAYLQKIITPVQEVDFTISKRFDVDHDFFTKPLNRYMNDFYFADKSMTSQGTPEDYDIFYPVETMKYDTIRSSSLLIDKTNYLSENLKTNTVVLEYADKGSTNELAVSSYLIRSNNNEEKTDGNGVTLGSPYKSTNFDIEEYKSTSEKRGKTTLLGVSFLDGEENEATKTDYQFEYAYNPSFDEFHKREIVRSYFFPSTRQGHPSATITTEPFQRALTPLGSYEEVLTGTDGLSTTTTIHSSVFAYDFLISFPFKEYTLNGSWHKNYIEQTLQPVNDAYGYFFVENCDICPQAWTLTSIKYPTGGIVSFEYEKGSFDQQADQLNWSFKPDQIPVVHNYNLLANKLSSEQYQAYQQGYIPPEVVIPPLYAAYEVSLPDSYGIRLKKKRINDLINPEVTKEFIYGTGHFTSLPSAYLQNYLQGFNQFIIRENFRWRSFPWYSSPSNSFASLALTAYSDIALDDYRSTHFYEKIETHNTDQSFIRRNYGSTIGTEIDYPEFSVFAFHMGYEGAQLVNKPRLTLAGDNVNRIPITIRSEEFFEGGETTPYKSIHYTYLRIIDTHPWQLDVDYTAGVTHLNELMLWNNQFPIHRYFGEGYIWYTSDTIPDSLYLPLLPESKMSYQRWATSKTLLKRKRTNYKGIITQTDYEYDDAHRISKAEISGSGIALPLITHTTYLHANTTLLANMVNLPVSTTQYLGAIAPENTLSAKAITYEFNHRAPKIKNTFVYKTDNVNPVTGTFTLVPFDYNSTNNPGWQIDQKDIYKYNRAKSAVSHRNNQLFGKTVFGYGLNLIKASFLHPDNSFDATYTGFEDMEGRWYIDEWENTDYLEEKWLMKPYYGWTFVPAVSTWKSVNPCTGQSGTQMNTQPGPGGSGTMPDPSPTKGGNYITVNDISNIEIGSEVEVRLQGSSLSNPNPYSWTLSTTVSNIFVNNQYPQRMVDFYYENGSYHPIWGDSGYEYTVCFSDPIEYPGSTHPWKSEYHNGQVSNEDAYHTINFTTVKVRSRLGHAISSTYAHTGKYSYKLPTKREANAEFRQTPVRPVRIHDYNLIPTECNTIGEPGGSVTFSSPPDYCFRNYEASVWLKYDYDLPKIGLPSDPMVPKSADTNADAIYVRGAVTTVDNGGNIKIICDVYNSTHTTLMEQFVFYPEDVSNGWKQYTIPIDAIPVTSGTWIDVYVVNEINQVGVGLKNYKSVFADDLLVYPKDAKYSYITFDKFGNETFVANNNDVFSYQRYDPKGRVISTYDVYGKLSSKISYSENAPLPSEQNHVTERIWVDNGMFNEKRYYLDGFGKTKQVMISDPDRGLRLVSESNVFDSQGRISRSYKPYVLQGASFENSYDPDFATRTNELYSSPNHFANAFIRADYENRPEEVLTSVSLPRMSFEGIISSTQHDFVTLTTITNPYTNESYVAGELIVHELQHPDGQTVRTYMDALGKVVLEEHRIGYNHFQNTDGSVDFTSSSPDLYAKTWFTYTADGKLTGIYDPNGKTTTFRYNSIGESIGTVSPDKGRTNFNYDKYGQLRFIKSEKDIVASSTNPYHTDQLKYFKYDKWGREIESGMVMSAEYNPNIDPNNLPFPSGDIFNNVSDIDNQDFPSTTLPLVQQHIARDYDGTRDQFNSDALKREYNFSGHILNPSTYVYQAVHTDMDVFHYLADGQPAKIEYSRSGLNDPYTYEFLYNSMHKLIGKSFIHPTNPGYNFTWNTQLDRFGRTSQNSVQHISGNVLTGKYYYDFLGNLLMQGIGGTGSGTNPHIDYVSYKQNIRGETTARLSNSLKIGLNYSPGGNITAQLWQNSHFDQVTDMNLYFYTYDKMNRLIGADYLNGSYDSDPFSFFNEINGSFPDDFTCVPSGTIMDQEMKPYFEHFDQNINDGKLVEFSRKAITSLKILSQLYIQNGVSYSYMTGEEQNIFLGKVIDRTKVEQAEIYNFEYVMADKEADTVHLLAIKDTPLTPQLLKYSNILLSNVSLVEMSQCEPNAATTAYGFLPDFSSPQLINNSTPYDVAVWYTENGNIGQLNRNNETGGKTEQTYTYGMSTNYLNQVDWLAPQQAPVSYNYQYDPVGNLTTDLKNGVSEIAYTHYRDLPVSITNNSGTKNYRYSANGVRTVKENSSYDIEYYLDDVILDNFGNVKSYKTPEGYVTPFFFDGEVNMEHYYHVTDWLGTIRGVIDQNGTLLNATDHYPYGMRMPGRSFISDAEGNRYQFTGHEHDGETGYDYHGARYYNSELGKYMSIDPLAAKFPAWSPYNYVLGNPVMYIDPDGRAPQDWVLKDNGTIYWDNNANDQASTKEGETYLGKELTFVFNSYIDADLWDGPMGSTPAGDKLTSTITLRASENDKGEITGISASYASVIGKTPVGKARAFYPGKGGSNQRRDAEQTMNADGTLNSFKIVFEQHASVSPEEESGMRLMGYKIVDVSQKLVLAQNKNYLWVGSYTNIFPSATLSVNGHQLMHYAQPSFKETHQAPIKGTWLPPYYEYDFRYYPSKFFKR
ncbi:hypothetical protein GCM10009118_14270 [Wandonia haliotis]|uniref:RHS repeat-associated core domain-containing protein n=2 Tax=Wandonia haliotis TaxID=574963 RepID=A0ABP3Y4F2_9FLAO